MRPAAQNAAFFRRLTALAGVISLATLAATTQANVTHQELFEQAHRALQKGAHQEAIDALELLSDRGFVHPAVSFNRALAYLGRASAPQAKSGDLGQAAAGFEESRLLDPNDQESGPALEHLRREIAREQAKSGSSPLVPKPTLWRALVSLCQETTWFILAAVGSVLLSFGLALRFWTKAAPAQIGALLASAAGAVLLLCCGALTHSARHQRLHTTPSVVIAPNARLLDSAGVPISGASTLVSEGSLVDVLETRDTRARIAWGSSDGWLNSSTLRRLPIHH